ncbi:type I restriction enzyme HsdR N-terminal domain-containing protein [Clostridium pasteurianum]|uniref:Type I restriction enzyme R protein N-terminal domain-containing protein n=1 Tax=Clostridium pasteurianum BC1 TaxID=86416 RepID=R4KAS3_CLOPA|nr:type I restriction enzyme HsdR N-terminal domain-containing protein [Clostridium pasteurianum]AGK97609.1 hypothetical protein Clopa_2770 [Clostridium pasteurianum BC1]
MYECQMSDLKEKRERLMVQNEKTVQNIIVTKFLEILGYNDEWYIYENDLYNSKLYSDISICIDRNKSLLLIVEVKNSNISINDDELEQLSRYMNAKKAEWGIITNGNDFILYNNDIDGNIDERVVWKYNLSNNKNIQYVRYFSYEYIFKKKVSNFFKYIRQFEVYFLENNKASSLKGYKGTLYYFFDFLATNKLSTFYSGVF